jgi:DNA-binding transcriptional LysR family regulator
LRHFAALYPRTQIELRIEGNGALIEALDKDQLDLALTIGFADRKDALLLGELPVLWIASRAFRTQGGSLPLAVLGPQCAFRKAALQQLETAGIPIVSRPPVQAWTAYGPRFKEGLVLPHAPLCSCQLI